MIYCKIQDNEITNRRDTKGDQLLESKMIAKGWLSYVSPDPPAHDEATQYLSAEDVIGAEAVTKTYTVNDKSPEQIEALFNTRKTEILDKLNKTVNQYILKYYDQGTQASFQSIYIIATESGDPVTANAIKNVWIWTQGVLQYYYTKKAEIQAASTLVDLAEDWDFAQFDLTKPDVSLGAMVS